MKGRAVNINTIAVQGSQQFLAPEIGEGVDQLGSCPEGQVIEESWRYLSQGNGFVLLTIIPLVKGAISDWKGCTLVNYLRRGRDSCIICRVQCRIKFRGLLLKK